MKYYEFGYTIKINEGVVKSGVGLYYTSGDPHLTEMEKIAKDEISDVGEEVVVLSYVEIDQDTFNLKRSDSFDINNLK
ncbi:MAG: hypothetical protein ACK5G0_01750 [Bacteroidota bacterium]|jgi:hypothetical protein